MYVSLTFIVILLFSGLILCEIFISIWGIKITIRQMNVFIQIIKVYDLIFSFNLAPSCGKMKNDTWRWQS